MSALALVIGRAGSTGVPGKNALPLAGRPMICWTLDAARAAATVEHIAVSTDGDAIAAAAVSMGVEVVRRPARLATDTARVDDVARHALDQLGADEPVVVILYANVPVRPPGLIDDAVRMLAATGADSVQSFANVGKSHPSWMARLDGEHRVTPYVARPPVHRRQDLEPLVVLDGGVIAVTAACLRRAAGGDDPHAFLGADRRGIETPTGSVVDVDTPLDLAVAETLLERRLAGAAP